MLDWAIRRDNVLVILGQRGSGKTTLIKWLIRNFNFKNTIVYDTIQTGDGNFMKEQFGDNVRVAPISADSSFWDGFNSTDIWRDKYIVIDELDMVNFYHRNFYTRWINVGRNFNSGGIISARRPTRLPRDTTANADYSILFRAHERSVIDFYKESFNDDIVELVKTLDKYEFIIVDANSEIVGNCKLRLQDNTLLITDL